jgi:hypothetical protein
MNQNFTYVSAEAGSEARRRAVENMGEEERSFIVRVSQDIGPQKEDVGFLTLARFVVDWKTDSVIPTLCPIKSVEKSNSSNIYLPIVLSTDPEWIKNTPNLDKWLYSIALHHKIVATKGLEMIVPLKSPGVVSRYQMCLCLTKYIVSSVEYFCGYNNTDISNGETVNDVALTIAVLCRTLIHYLHKYKELYDSPFLPSSSEKDRLVLLLLWKLFGDPVDYRIFSAMMSNIVPSNDRDYFPDITGVDCHSLIHSEFYGYNRDKLYNYAFLLLLFKNLRLMDDSYESLVKIQKGIMLMRENLAHLKTPTFCDIAHVIEIILSEVAQFSNLDVERVSELILCAYEKGSLMDVIKSDKEFQPKYLINFYAKFYRRNPFEDYNEICNWTAIEKSHFLQCFSDLLAMEYFYRKSDEENLEKWHQYVKSIAEKALRAEVFAHRALYRMLNYIVKDDSFLRKPGKLLYGLGSKTSSISTFVNTAKRNYDKNCCKLFNINVIEKSCVDASTINKLRF